MPFGWQSPWPLQWGGTPTPIEAALASLRAVVGKGHPADRDGIEWRWREARAIGLACVSVLMERAINQFYPATATDGLAFWRDLYSLPDSTPDQEARDTSAELFHREPKADIPTLTAELQSIDPRFIILEKPWSSMITTIHGRTVEPWSGTPAFNLPGGRGDTIAPNYSDAFSLAVQLTTGSTPPTGSTELKTLQRARDYLDDALPAWVSYEIMGSTGFILDTSPLDWTGL